MRVNIIGVKSYNLNIVDNVEGVHRGESSGVVTKATDMFHDAFTRLLEGYNNFADEVVGKQIQFILKPVGIFIRDCFYSLIHLLNTNSVEIITVSMIACAICMMVAPLLGYKGAVWFGRILSVGIVGTLWRVVI